ncbi:MAG: glutathione peroxidase [Ruminococcus sp.]|nr:glutathione peroxidase [Ruminococcus sp.]
MSFYDFTVKTRRGEDFDLSTLRGKAVLVVNTATGCGFTPQYKGLEALYERYHERGLEILDFPCNQFNNQAPGSDEEIHQFCTLRYKTQFDQMKKIEVNGENESPLYTFLKREMPDEEVKGLKARAAMKAVSKLSKSTRTPSDIKWNFTKFLVDRTGRVVGRYNPTVEPEKLSGDIEAILG